MRSATALALALLGLGFAVRAEAGWTVGATGECVPAWIAPPGGQGPVAMLNALPLPFRQAVGGGQVAAAGGPGTSGFPMIVLQWPALVLGGFAVGAVEAPVWLIAGLADTVTLGTFDIVPEDAKALTLTPVRPRFLTPIGMTPERCAAQGGAAPAAGAP